MQKIDETLNGVNKMAYMKEWIWESLPLKFGIFFNNNKKNVKYKKPMITLT